MCQNPPTSSKLSPEAYSRVTPVLAAQWKVQYRVREVRERMIIEERGRECKELC